MTAFGVVTGAILSGASLITGHGGRISIENNAITFTTGFNLNGSITFGNSIIHAGGDIRRWNVNSTVSRYNRAAYVNLGKHEEAHTYQYQTYGIFTIALLLASAIANGGLATSSFHDFMAKSDFEHAADDYAQFGWSPIPFKGPE
ncbi:MAG: hypothetical protein LBF87_02885 [Treponema sp.]|jgi:hypothetical protein|nr:hypothetical protein [Treponema sp.]